MSRQLRQRLSQPVPSAAEFIASLERQAQEHRAAHHPLLERLASGLLPRPREAIAAVVRARRTLWPVLHEVQGAMAQRLRADRGMALPRFSPSFPVWLQAAVAEVPLPAAGTEEAQWPLRFRALCRADMARALGAMLFGDFILSRSLNNQLLRASALIGGLGGAGDSGAVATPEAAVLRTLRDHAESMAQVLSVRDDLERGAWLALSLREAVLDELLETLGGSDQAAAPASS